MILADMLFRSTVSLVSSKYFLSSFPLLVVVVVVVVVVVTVVVVVLVFVLVGGYYVLIIGSVWTLRA